MAGADGGQDSGLFVYVDYSPPPARLDGEPMVEGEIYNVTCGATQLSATQAAGSSPSSDLPLIVGETTLTLRVFVDHVFAEVYWQQGRRAMTLPFPIATEAAIAVKASGEGAAVTANAVDAWAVGSIWVAPEEVLRTPRADAGGGERR